MNDKKVQIYVLFYFFEKYKFVTYVSGFILVIEKI